MEATRDVRTIDIDQEMQQSYLDYAMSVIVSRALPDARDGLKPVHRRILYAMHDMGLRPDTPYKKSARVVGEVLGKYHPHSDQAVYDAMARMAQDFSMRVPLVDGQGNFGSVDGDPPAAMRYTEARLAPPADQMLQDIRKDTVDFVENFDSSLEEPQVLPAIVPNLLVNGATGIAVGMSTNIPPHNLGEVVDALGHMIKNWKRQEDINVEELMKFVQGPDFPTGGVILKDTEKDGIATAYGTGRGRITLQAMARVESIGRGRERILVTELPFQVNKSNLIEKIANLAREGAIEGITDLRDESDRQGMRIVIELSKTADANKVLAGLYKRTQMQGTFGIITLALVNGEPRLLSLKQALKVFIEHRLEVVRRRSEHDLAKAQARAHVLEGLLVALENLDDVVQLIRDSRDVDSARSKLMKSYKLSEIQANAILDMPLRRLAALERKKIETEYKETQALIKKLEDLLASPKRMLTVISNELSDVKEAFGERRRTQIVEVGKGGAMGGTLTAGELEAGKTLWVAVNDKGQISRSVENKSPRPSGKDAPRFLLQASSRDTLLLIAENGKAAAIAVHALPEAESLADGEAISRVTALKPGETLAAVAALPPEGMRPDGFLITVSATGVVKKSEISELPGPGAQSVRLAGVKKNDRLVAAMLTDGKQELLFATREGMAIRFKEGEVRAMGLTASGVNGIKLKGQDEVVAALALDAEEPVTMVASDGRAKNVKVKDFPLQGRYGQGVIAWKLEGSQTLVGAANQRGTTRATVYLDKLAAKSIRLDEPPVGSRQASGKELIELRDDDRIVALVVPGSVVAPVKKTREKQTSTTSSSSKTKASTKKKPAAKKKVSSRKKATKSSSKKK
jgi:DNA gyrase subunit A